MGDSGVVYCGHDEEFDKRKCHATPTFLLKGREAGQWLDDDDEGGNRIQRNWQGVRITSEGSDSVAHVAAFQ